MPRASSSARNHVAAIGDEVRCPGQGAEQKAGTLVVAHLAFRQEQDDWPAFTVANGVALGVQSALVAIWPALPIGSNA
jgi:hypothetical protein